MKRRLFLTGPIGCGKSTAIAAALGDRLPHCGGLLTRRHRDPWLRFTLETPDGSFRKTFLELPDGRPQADLSVFSELPLRGQALVLDEIGGIELLEPSFLARLENVLSGDIPILGVIKGEGPAKALTDALGLSEKYAEAAARLRRRLREDPDTLVIECGRYDENALRLARQWVEEYLPGGKEDL